MKGTWTGFYKHTSKRIPESRRNQATKFSILIENLSNNHFSGFINDDLDTGGMEGKGTIKGKIKNDKISFVKEMPTEHYFDKTGERFTTSNKHAKIYYSGKFDQTTQKYVGEWKFKFGFTKINGKIAIVLPEKGYWEMGRGNEI